MEWKCIARRRGAIDEIVEKLTSDLSVQVDERLDLLVTNRGLKLEDLTVIYNPIQEVDGILELTAVIVTNVDTSPEGVSGDVLPSS